MLHLGERGGQHAAPAGLLVGSFFAHPGPLARCGPHANWWHIRYRGCDMLVMCGVAGLAVDWAGRMHGASLRSVWQGVCMAHARGTGDGVGDM